MLECKSKKIINGLKWTLFLKYSLFKFFLYIPLLKNINRDIISKEYLVVTFLSILDLTRKQEIDIKQESNFDKIYISEKVNNE